MPTRPSSRHEHAGPDRSRSRGQGKPPSGVVDSGQNIWTSFNRSSPTVLPLLGKVATCEGARGRTAGITRSHNHPGFIDEISARRLPSMTMTLGRPYHPTIPRDSRQLFTSRGFERAGLFTSLVAYLGSAAKRRLALTSADRFDRSPFR
jgi:hypothetical protein